MRVENTKRIEVLPMFSAIIAVVIFAALANASRSGRSDLITSRPYNNRYNAASGAREQLDVRDRS